MLKVYVLYEYDIHGRPHGASYIRLLLPLDHPALTGLKVQFGYKYHPCDVLIIDRTWTPWITPSRAERLVKGARQDGCRILYSIDDNLLDFDLYNLYRHHFSAEQMDCVRFFAREADAIVTTTSHLRDRLLRLNPKVYVVPNALDERLFPSELPQGIERTGKLTLGYMGTYTHEADLFMILEPLRRFLRERKESVNFQLVGISTEVGFDLAFSGLPVQILRAEGVTEYPVFIHWMLDHIRWDFGVAPLVDNPFTRCKSDIKFLDYSLMGIPGIYSDVEAYKATVRSGETGLLANERPASWYEGLCRLADDSDLRVHIRENAFRMVRRERVLERCVSKWQHVIEEVSSGKAHQP